MPTAAINYNPFALLNPGPLPPRIPNTFGPPPGTIMPNNYDRIKAMLDEQQAGAAMHGQRLQQPFTAEQLFLDFPQSGATPQQQLEKILAQQEADTQRFWHTSSGNPTAAQIMQQNPPFPVNPLPPAIQAVLDARARAQPLAANVGSNLAANVGADAIPQMKPRHALQPLGTDVRLGHIPSGLGTPGSFSAFQRMPQPAPAMSAPYSTGGVGTKGGGGGGLQRPLVQRQRSGPAGK